MYSDKRACVCVYDVLHECQAEISTMQICVETSWPAITKGKKMGWGGGEKAEKLSGGYKVKEIERWLIKDTKLA